MKKIIDIKDMPNFNPAVPNGLDNVSKGEVYFGICRVGQYNGFRELSLPTIVCDDHGAMLCVSLIKLEDENMIEKIWRCPACNKGAFEKVETMIDEKEYAEGLLYEINRLMGVLKEEVGIVTKLNIQEDTLELLEDKK